jgi:hypothetical protein
MERGVTVLGERLLSTHLLWLKCLFKEANGETKLKNTINIFQLLSEKHDGVSQNKICDDGDGAR